MSPKLPVGTVKLTLRCGRANADSSREVVHDLRQNAGKVDRVHSGQFDLISEIEIVEHVLQRGLTVVKIAIHGERMDIAIRWRSSSGGAAPQTPVRADRG